MSSKNTWWEAFKDKSEYEQLKNIGEYCYFFLHCRGQSPDSTDEAIIECFFLNTVDVCNEDVVKLRPNDKKFQDFPKYVSDAFKTYSHNYGAVKIVLPKKQRSNNELVKQTVEPKLSHLLQIYEKRAEGVHKDINTAITYTPLTTFIAKGITPSLSKIGFGLYDDENRCWAGMFTLFDDMLKEGRFSTSSTRMELCLQTLNIHGELTTQLLD